VEKPTVQILPRTLGIYGPDFFATHEDKGKGVKAFNAIVSSSNITIVNDRIYFDKISSVNRYLSPRCHFRILRVEVSGLASARELALGYFEYRNAEMFGSTRTILPHARV
jgi:hypothetical protein